jgi:hypothetical protein
MRNVIGTPTLSPIIWLLSPLHFLQLSYALLFSIKS